MEITFEERAEILLKRFTLINESGERKIDFKVLSEILLELMESSQESTKKISHMFTERL